MFQKNKLPSLTNRENYYKDSEKLFKVLDSVTKTCQEQVAFNYLDLFLNKYPFVSPSVIIDIWETSFKLNKLLYEKEKI